VNDGAATLTSDDIKLLSDTLSDFIFTILGLNNTSSAGSNGTEKLKGVVEMLIQMRNEARANKNFALSDEIRDKLQELGIIIKDGKEGTTFSF
jgi:cysteinyl-tRNA synthetase